MMTRKLVCAVLSSSLALGTALLCGCQGQGQNGTDNGSNGSMSSQGNSNYSPGNNGNQSGTNSNPNSNESGGGNH